MATTMSATNQTSPTPTSPPPPAKPTRSEVLSNVMTMAMQFSTCVEAFNLIHPHNDGDRYQKVALAKLGIQQGRLLIWGDAMGISSPPQTIARHMIPSHPGLTNPDPTVPVNFGVRDPRLDEPENNAKIRAALEEIAGRPSNMGRDQLMLKYGLKTPKHIAATTRPALDNNRLEAFREKFALLKDLVRQSGIRGSWQRAGSMTLQKWVVKNTERFEEFVDTVRQEVDGLIEMMGVKEQVDRGMKTDIKAMAWHPELTSPVLRADWEKLRLIREAVQEDYPDYFETADRALKYISDQLKEHPIPSGLKLSYRPAPPIRRRSSIDREVKAAKKQPISSMESKPNPSINVTKAPENAKEKEKEKEKDKKSGIFSKLSRWGKGSGSQKSRTKRAAQPQDKLTVEEDTQRSLSADDGKASFEYTEDLRPARSKSLSAIPNNQTESMNAVLANQGANQASGIGRVNGVANDTNGAELTTVPTTTEDHTYDKEALYKAETVNSLIERHDMYHDVGRIETKDIRDKSKDAATGT